MNPETYAARREQRRKGQFWVHIGVLVLVAAAQALRMTPGAVGLVLVGYVAAFGALVLYLRNRRPNGTMSCPAQVPAWALSDEPGFGRSPTLEYRGSLWFFPGSLEWR